MLIISVCLAVLASCANGTSSVLQRKAAREMPGGDRVGIPELWRLLHRPVWVLGVVMILVGFLLQAGALGTGPIALVQPLLIFELPFALMLSGRAFHARLHWHEWAAIVGMCVGLALMLAALNPAGGDPLRATAARWTLGVTVTLLVAAVLVALGTGRQGSQRAVLFGVATGIVFGFTAALVAVIAEQLPRGASEVLNSWQIYGLVVCGPLGFLLLQNALRAGRLVASQPALTLTNPLAGSAWGIWVFGEQVRSGGWLAAELVGALIVIGFTVLLANSPLLHDDSEPERRRAG